MHKNAFFYMLYRPINVNVGISQIANNTQDWKNRPELNLQLKLYYFQFS